jgi:MFS family permease
MALVAGAAAWLALLHSSPWEVLVGTAAMGVGAGFGIGVASTLIAETSHGGETGIATALNSVVRRVGGGFAGR